MLAIATLVCLGASFAGVYLSFFIDSAPAPTVVLILTGCFLIAFVRNSLRIRRASRRA